jgi:hypothetical protein
MRRLLVLLSVVLICCLPVITVNAQSASSATITGQVVDPQGLVIANATVTATNVATGVAHSAKTTSSGNYTIPNLAPGTYNVKVDAPRFIAGETMGVKLNLGDSRDLGFKLGVAGSTESVEVTTQAPLIETTKTDVSTSVTDLDMERLPTIAGAGGTVNDYAQLALTAPGVKLDTSGLTTDIIAPGSINNRGNLFNVDGANITDQLVSGRDSTGAAVDEVQEFQVLTNSYNAEYGQATGLVLNVVTKSGTNSVHGEGHTYFRGRNLAASNPFYDLSLFSTALPRSVSSVTAPHCPDSDFTGIGTPAQTLTSLDGCDRAPFHRQEGGFTIGGPLIKDKLFFFGSYELSRQTLPLTLTPGAAEGGPVTVPQPTNNLLYAGKLDYHVSQNNTLSVRYAVDRLRTSNVIVQTGNNVAPSDLTSSLINNASVNVGLVSSITPNLVNEGRFVFYRFVTQTADNSTAPGIVHPDGSQTGADFCCPQAGLQKRYQYIDNLTFTKSKHTWKTGFNVSYYPFFSLFPQFSLGQFIANAANNGATSFTFSAGPGEVTSKDNIYGFYVQDTWKLSRKLTVNYGVRYDYEAGAFKGGKIRGSGDTCLQGNGLVSACSSDKNNLQPRLGFTYAAFENTLIRASVAETTQLAFNNVVLDSLNFDGTTLKTITVPSIFPGPGPDPLPAQRAALFGSFPNAPSAMVLAAFTPFPLTAPPFGRVRPIASNLKNPEIRQVNFGIEHEFSKTLKGQIQYIGQFGFGLFGERDRNAPPVIADPANPGFFFFGDRPNPNFTSIRTNENSRTSHYNGMVVSATKTLSHHVQFNASYTWSHAITSGEDFFGLSEPADFVNIRPELGNAFNDVRHAANMGVVLDSGKVSGNKLTGLFANNLTMGWVGQVQSGRPYPISTGSSGFANGRFFGAGSETQQRPNVLPDGTISVAGLASAFGDLGLFANTPDQIVGGNLVLGSHHLCTNQGFTDAYCNSLQNTFLAPGAASGLGAVDVLTGETVDFKQVSGNLGRDAGRGAPFVKFDTSLQKVYSIPGRENIKVELRFDAFNLLNHTNYQSFNSNDVLTALPFSLDTNCTLCQRPNGTFAGANGQTLHIRDLTHGRISSNLLKPVFGGLGEPGAADIPRTLQLSFHVRF